MDGTTENFKLTEGEARLGVRILKRRFGVQTWVCAMVSTLPSFGYRRARGLDRGFKSPSPSHRGRRSLSDGCDEGNCHAGRGHEGFRVLPSTVTLPCAVRAIGGPERKERTKGMTATFPSGSWMSCQLLAGESEGVGDCERDSPNGGDDPSDKDPHVVVTFLPLRNTTTPVKSRQKGLASVRWTR